MADDMMSTLKGLLGDNADEKIQSVLQALQSTAQESGGEPAEQKAAPADISGSESMSATSPGGMNLENIEYIMRLKSLMEEMGNANDDRSNLLLSLRPYMRKERQQGIDQAIRILNLSKFSGLFKL